LPKLKFQP
jgi:hypothetical protein